MRLDVPPLSWQATSAPPGPLYTFMSMHVRAVQLTAHTPPPPAAEDEEDDEEVQLASFHDPSSMWSHAGQNTLASYPQEPPPVPAHEKDTALEASAWIFMESHVYSPEPWHRIVSVWLPLGPVMVKR